MFNKAFFTDIFTCFVLKYKQPMKKKKRFEIGAEPNYSTSEALSKRFMYVQYSIYSMSLPGMSLGTTISER